jgi:hypothetical protein
MMGTSMRSRYQTMQSHPPVRVLTFMVITIASRPGLSPQHLHEAFLFRYTQVGQVLTPPESGLIKHTANTYFLHDWQLLQRACE